MKAHQTKKSSKKSNKKKSAKTSVLKLLTDRDVKVATASYCEMCDSPTPGN